jgi:hypothetical protein
MSTTLFLLTRRDGRTYVVPLCRRCRQRIAAWKDRRHVGPVTTCGCGTQRTRAASRTT